MAYAQHHFEWSEQFPGLIHSWKESTPSPWSQMQCCFALYACGI